MTIRTARTRTSIPPTLDELTPQRVAACPLRIPSDLLFSSSRGHFQSEHLDLARAERRRDHETRPLRPSGPCQEPVDRLDLERLDLLVPHVRAPALVC